MAQVNPYLMFNGNCAEAFDFYKSVFGGEFKTKTTFGDMPPAEGEPALDADTAKRIMHMSLPISAETLLMGSDTHPRYGDTKMGGNISLSVDVKSKEEADKVFNGLAAGGEIRMPIAMTFWNAYFGMLTDKFGIEWMVNYDHPQQ